MLLTIHFLTPLTRYDWGEAGQTCWSTSLTVGLTLPSFESSAVVCSPATSLPANGSEMARQMCFSPRRTAGMMAAF